MKLAGFGLMVAAISQEMSKPEADRTWHGKVFGLVPYAFRPPTWDRSRDSYWNPEDERLFTDRWAGPSTCTGPRSTWRRGSEP